MAIIGISGKIGSGKDTVGKIIQYLTTKKEDISYRGTYTSYCIDIGCGGIPTSTWEIKRFAGKLKEVCSILIGIPIEDFEKQEVKDRVLGEEWNRFYFTRAKARSFSIGHNVYTWHNENKFFTSYEEATKELSIVLKEIDDHSPEWWEIKEESITVRHLLQMVGTDAMRNIIHHNVWVNALFADYIAKVVSKSVYTPGSFKDGGSSKVTGAFDYPNWVITDTRFPNEAQAIKDRGGLLIRVNRNMIITDNKDGTITLSGNPENFKLHPSETSLDNYQFDEIIDNNSSIEEFIEQVKQILIKYKIL